MTILEFSSEIDATLKELFEFHTDFKNVLIVTPSLIHVRFKQIPEKMVRGSEFTVEINQFGFWLPWDIKVAELIPYTVMIDFQSGRGPFKYWRHEHIFSQRNTKTVLTDRIEYQLPFGVLGTIADIVVMRFIQGILFRYRHKRTREYFSTQ